MGKFNQYRILAQLLSNTFLTALNVLASFAAIPLFFTILGQENYGVWLALYSMITWVSFVDIGIGSGLRNLLSEAIAKGSKREISSLLTTSIYSQSSILAIAFISILIVVSFVDIGFLFPNYINEDLTSLFLFAIGSFFLIVQGKTMHSAAAAYHFSEVSTLVNTTQNIAICVILFFIGFWGFEAPFLVFSISFFLLSIVLYSMPLFVFAIWNSGPRVLSIANFSISNAFKIFSLGGRFFVLQISAVILYSTDTFLLQYFFSPKVAAEYGIFLKYYGILVLVTSVAGAPIWSAVATDMQSKERGFLILLRQKSPYLIAFLISTGAALFFFQDIIFSIWVPNLSTSEASFATWVLIYSIMQCLLFCIGNVVNGSGFLFLTAITAPMAAISNLLICIAGIRYFDQGVNWIVISTIISNFPSLIVIGFQSYKILNNQCHGVWAR